VNSSYLEQRICWFTDYIVVPSICCRQCVQAVQWTLLQSLATDEAAMEAAFQAMWSCKEVMMNV